MSEKCWCGKELEPHIYDAPYRDAGVLPVIECPEHGQPGGVTSLQARAEAAEAERDRLRAAIAKTEEMSDFAFYADPYKTLPAMREILRGAVTFPPDPEEKPTP